MKTKPNNSDWQERFDKEFPSLSVIEGQGDEGSIHGYDAKPYIKDFITKTLQQQREDLLDKIKKYMETNIHPSGGYTDECIKEDILEFLQSLKQDNK